MKLSLVVFLLMAGVLAKAAEPPVNGVSVKRWTYPGAKDEQDIEVQKELIPPADKLDRETQAETIRNNLFKKAEKQTDSKE